MSVNIQIKMEKEVKSFNELGDMFLLCLNNFENVIQPKLPKNKIEDLPRDAEVPLNLAKIDPTLNFKESFDEILFLRDFSKSKAGKESAKPEDNFNELFNHCLDSYEKQRIKSQEIL